MEEDQERVSSSDEERQIIEDEDMEDSPTDIPELWMPDRNNEDTLHKAHPRTTPGQVRSQVRG